MLATHTHFCKDVKLFCHVLRSRVVVINLQHSPTQTFLLKVFFSSWITLLHQNLHTQQGPVLVCLFIGGFRAHQCQRSICVRHEEAHNHLLCCWCRNNTHPEGSYVARGFWRGLALAANEAKTAHRAVGHKALHRLPHEVLEVQSSHSEQRRHLKCIFYDAWHAHRWRILGAH